jgi:hypothetical protein
LKGASLGVHHGAFPGVREDNYDSIQANVFRLAGFADSFIRRALATPNSDIWEPSADVLLAAKVVTSVTDGAKFAYSGVGRDFDRESIATKLADASPIFRAMQARFPKRYDAVVDQFVGDLAKGRTFTEIMSEVRARVLPFVRELVPMADEYVELNAKDPTGCYQYASGEGSSYDVVTKLSDGLVRREQRLQERVLLTATKRAAGDKAQIESQ